LVKYHLREEIIDKEVIELEAKKVGIIKDLAFTLDGELVLIVETETNKGELKETFLSFKKIIKIADVVLVKSKEDLEPAK
jgi:sporulation protein YlmC with PRC-barrel domain